VDQQEALVQEDLELVEAVADAMLGPVVQRSRPEDPLELGVGGRTDAGAGCRRRVELYRVGLAPAGEFLGQGAMSINRRSASRDRRDRR
jgi:hypothetical protein